MKRETSLTKEFFIDIADLAKRALSLLHLNTDSERIFSWISDVKIEKRNRLKKERIEAFLVLKSQLRTKYVICCKNVPTHSQIKLHDSKNH